MESGAGLVCTLKKNPSFEQAVKTGTNHSAIIDGTKHNSIVSTTSTMRMNTKLIRATQLLRRFNLITTHRPGKEHIIPETPFSLPQQGRISTSKLFGIGCIFHSLSIPGKSQGAIYEGTLQ